MSRLGHALAGAGATGVGAGEGDATIGVTVTPVTSPLMASFCFLPFVPRARRVARAFAVAVARFSVPSLRPA